MNSKDSISNPEVVLSIKEMLKPIMDDLYEMADLMDKEKSTINTSEVINDIQSSIKPFMDEVRDIVNAMDDKETS